MSELHHRYDRMAVSDRITQPPFAELADRGRRRAHRTRTVRLAGVAVLAALVAAPLLTLPGKNQPGTSGAPSPPTWDPLQIQVSFVDLHFGVAHYYGEACGDEWFSVTRDGGKTWSKLREQPQIPGQDSSADTDDGPTCNRQVMIPIAPDTLVMPADIVLPSKLPDRPSLISRNAGRTWQRYHPQVKTADSVPDGINLGWPCDDKPCKEAGLGWYEPGTGNWMVLRNQPAGVEYYGGTVGFDGSIWMYGTDSDGDFHLAVSRDGGRSWLNRSPDAGNGLAPGLTVYDGNTAYRYAAQDPILYRTTDGGQTWHPMPAPQQLKDVAFVWTNRQGGLVVSDRSRNLYLSTDGGETFARTELPVWGALPIVGGLEGWPLDRAAADPVDLYLSEDGLTWQPVQVPYYPGPDGAPSSPQTPGR